MRSLLLVPILAACGGPSKPADAPGNHADAVAVTPCPDDAALLEVGAQAWPASTEIADVWCVAVRVDGEPRWYLSGYARDGEDAEGASPHRALVAPDGALVWAEADAYDAYYPSGRDAEARDLDGDGTDEVVYHQTQGEGGAGSYGVVVVGVAGGGAKLGVAELGYTAMDEGCEADWTIEDGWIVITGDGECATYSGRYRWDGTTLVTE